MMKAIIVIKLNKYKFKKIYNNKKFNKIFKKNKKYNNKTIKMTIRILKK